MILVFVDLGVLVTGTLMEKCRVYEFWNYCKKQIEVVIEDEEKSWMIRLMSQI